MSDPELTSGHGSGRRCPYRAVARAREGRGWNGLIGIRAGISDFRIWRRQSSRIRGAGRPLMSPGVSEHSQRISPYSARTVPSLRNNRTAASCVKDWPPVRCRSRSTSKGERTHGDPHRRVGVPVEGRGGDCGRGRRTCRISDAARKRQLCMAIPSLPGFATDVQRYSSPVRDRTST